MRSLSQQIYHFFIYEDRYLLFLDGLKTTLILSVFSFVLASVCGAIFCSMIRNKNRVAHSIGKIIVWLSVQLPAAVALIIMVNVIFRRLPLALELTAIIALGIKMTGYIANVFLNAIDNVEPGETEAARSLGMTDRQAFLYVTLPQTIKNAMSLYKNQFMVTLQMTSIVGYVAIQDLTKVSNVVTGRSFDDIFGLIVITVLYILIGFIVTKLLSLLYREKHMDSTGLDELLTSKTVGDVK